LLRTHLLTLYEGRARSWRAGGAPSAGLADRLSPRAQFTVRSFETTELTLVNIHQLKYNSELNAHPKRLKKQTMRWN